MLSKHVVNGNGLGIHTRAIKARGKADDTITFDGCTCPNCSNAMTLAQLWEGCLACGYVERPRH